MADELETTPNADPAVTQDGATTRVVAERTPEADAAATTTTAVGTPGLPEGFATVEDFVKAVNEGTYKPNGLESEGTTTQTNGTTKEEPKTGVDLQVQTTLEQLGPEFGAKAEPFVRELATTGDLSADSVAKAAKDLGIPQSLVEQYVADRKAEAQTVDSAAVAPVYELVGGQENFAGFQAWANEALGPNEHSAINEALGLSADGKEVLGAPDAAKLQEYTEAYKASGRAPAARDVTTEGTASVSDQGVSSDVFGSIAEQTAAVNDPRYRTNKGGYRDQVIAKMGRSNL